MLRLNTTDIPQLATYSPRNLFKLTRGRNQTYHPHCQIRFNFLLNRTATVWNDLPLSVVMAQKLNSFKKRVHNLNDSGSWK